MADQVTLAAIDQHQTQTPIWISSFPLWFLIFSSLVVVYFLLKIFLDSNKIKEKIVSLKRDFEKNEANFKILHQVTSSPQTSFGEKIHSLLDLGLKWFAFDEGFFAWSKNGTLEIADAWSLKGSALSRGQLIPISESHSELFKKALTFTSLNESLVTFSSTVSARTKKQKQLSTLAAPVFVGGKVTGILIFQSTTLQEKQLSLSHAKTVVMLMAQWLGTELDRKKAEKDRNRVFSLSTDLLAIVSFHGIFQDLNSAWETTVGFPLDDLIGQPFLNYIHPLDLQHTQKYLSELSTGSTLPRIESRYLCQDQTYRWISWSGVPYIQEHQYYLIAHDVTDRKRSEASLQEATEKAHLSDRTKSEFLACLSSEIASPLTAILGMAELISKSTLSAEQQNNLNILTQAGTELQNLVTDVIVLSQLETEMAPIESVPFDLRQIISRLTPAHEKKAQEKKIHFQSVMGALPTEKLVGDPKRLAKTIGNLLNNAVKYTQSGSVSFEIKVTNVSPDRCELHGRVTDTGPGISPDILKLSFEQMTLSAWIESRLKGGGSRGLAISKRIVESMEGKISVKSELGLGTDISFSIPLEIAKEHLGESRHKAKKNESTEKSIVRILSVEDSEDNQLLMQSFLRPPKFQIEIAENGRIGSHKFVENSFDIVLMDMQMPELDGYAATQEIRAWEKQQGYAPTPIIALSASGSREDLERSRAAGCSAFLIKPVDLEFLRTVIEALLEVGSSNPHLTPAPANSMQPQARSVPATFQASIKKMIPVFLANRAKDIAKIRSALEISDFESIRLIGHSMKGSGGSYGFMEITDLGARLEQAAKDLNVENIRTETDSLSQWLESMRSVNCAIPS